MHWENRNECRSELEDTNSKPGASNGNPRRPSHRLRAKVERQSVYMKSPCAMSGDARHGRWHDRLGPSFARPNLLEPPHMDFFGPPGFRFAINRALSPSALDTVDLSTSIRRCNTRKNGLVGPAFLALNRTFSLTWPPYHISQPADSGDVAWLWIQFHGRIDFCVARHPSLLARHRVVSRKDRNHRADGPPSRAFQVGRGVDGLERVK